MLWLWRGCQKSVASTLATRPRTGCNDDVEVAESLINGRANLEALGASIAGGLPLNCAVREQCRSTRMLVPCERRMKRNPGASAANERRNMIRFGRYRGGVGGRRCRRSRR